MTRIGNTEFYKSHNMFTWQREGDTLSFISGPGMMPGTHDPITEEKMQSLIEEKLPMLPRYPLGKWHHSLTLTEDQWITDKDS